MNLGIEFSFGLSSASIFLISIDNANGEVSRTGFKNFYAACKIRSVAAYLTSMSRPSLNLTEISMKPFCGLLSAIA